MPVSRSPLPPTTSRVVFVDVDGTLVDHDGRVPDSAKHAIHAARANGHLVFMCTGRSRPELWPEVTDIGFDGLIAGAGAFAAVGDLELVHRHFDPAQVERVADFFGRHGFDYFFEGAYGLFGTHGVRDRVETMLRAAVADAARFANLRRGFFAYMDLIQVDPRPGRPVSKLLFLLEEGVTFEDVRAEFGDFHVIPSSVPTFGTLCGEMQLPGVHKASGIDAVLAHLGIPRERTIALGDSDNDLEMLRHAGIGIAMGNARPHVKDAADEVTAAVDEDGVHQALARHGLLG
ncbi:MAG: HAD family hydrolase [Nigerium sp.]|nr:HAD family hydrolase [Nigerium sp.]